jgi:hypothetical protein
LWTVSQLSRQCGILNISQPSTACYGDGFTFFLLYLRKTSLEVTDVLDEIRAQDYANMNLERYSFSYLLANNIWNVINFTWRHEWLLILHVYLHISRLTPFSLFNPNLQWRITIPTLHPQIRVLPGAVNIYQLFKKFNFFFFRNPKYRYRIHKKFANGPHS